MLGNPAIAAFVEHHALLYDDLSGPRRAAERRDDDAARSASGPMRRAGQAIRAGGRAEDERAYAHYGELMSQSQALIAEDVLDAFSARGRRAWLDVGGGEGAFLAAVAKRGAALDLMLFDLPPVAARARAALEKRGLSARVRVFGGDFLADPLPQGADVVSLVRVLHDHDDESALLLLRRAHAALPRGGGLADRRTDGRDARRRAGRRRLFRLLSAGDGPRPAALGRGNRGACCSSAGFSGAAAVADPPPAAGQRRDCASCVNLVDVFECPYYSDTSEEQPKGGGSR